MNNHVFTITTFVLSTTMLVGCGGDSDTDTGAPKPPPSGVEVDGAMAKPASGTTADAGVALPGFDTTSLPGLAAADWTTTPGGSWYATVTPGLGTGVAVGTGSVTVSMSIWTEDGTPVLLAEEQEQDLVIPMGDTMFPGWNETIEGMRVGETRKITIPWEQSLGGDGRGLVQCEDGSDDPQMLVADVTLVGIDASVPTIASAPGS